MIYCLSIARTCIEISAPSEKSDFSEREHFQQTLKRFQTNVHKPDLRVSLRYSMPDCSCFQFEPRKYGILYAKSANSHIFKNEESLSILNLNDKNLAIHVMPSSSPESAYSALRGHLRNAISYLSMQNGGFPLHCSACSLNNKATAFFGPSQSGKSTIAGLLCPEYSLLSDEFNIILPDAGGYAIYATPFTSLEFLRKQTCVCARLASLYYIKKARHNAVESMPLKNARFALISSAYALAADDESISRLMQNAMNLAADIKVQELSFKNDLSFKPFIDQQR